MVDMIKQQVYTSLFTNLNHDEPRYSYEP